MKLRANSHKIEYDFPKPEDAQNPRDYEGFHVSELTFDVEYPGDHTLSVCEVFELLHR
jgi:hypothetical protein